MVAQSQKGNTPQWHAVYVKNWGSAWLNHPSVKLSQLTSKPNEKVRGKVHAWTLDLIHILCSLITFPLPPLMPRHTLTHRHLQTHKHILTHRISLWAEIQGKGEVDYRSRGALFKLDTALDGNDDDLHNNEPLSSSELFKAIVILTSSQWRSQHRQPSYMKPTQKVCLKTHHIFYHLYSLKEACCLIRKSKAFDTSLYTFSRKIS